MANQSAKFPEYRHGRPYHPPAAAAADQIDDTMQIPHRRHYPSPADKIDQTMLIPQSHGGPPYYPSEPAGKIVPRRRGPPYYPSLPNQAQPSDYDHYDYDYDYQHGPQIYPSTAAAANGNGPFMNGPQIYPSKPAAAANGNRNGNGYNTKKKAAAVPVATSDESALRKKLHEIHAHSDDGTAFHTQPLLESIQGILDHVDDTHRFTNCRIIDNSTDLVDQYPPAPQPTRPLIPIFDALPYLLHKITCMLNCKCGGGDGHALALEILEVVADYSWEAKIVIVLAAFSVEFGHYGLVATHKDNELAKLLAYLRQTPNVVEAEVEEGDADYMIIRSKMETIIRISRLSIEVTKLIARFDQCLLSNHITSDAEPMLVALNQIPISVYWMIRVVIACASEHSQILGHTEIITSYTETWSITSLEKQMGVKWKILATQYELCYTYIEEKIQKQFYDKLIGIFSHTYKDNQIIFQTIFNTIEYTLPLSFAGSDPKGVDILKRKTVLLLISDLTISNEEIEIISRFYKESKRVSSQYEIVWVPIVKQMEVRDEERFEGLKGVMPWLVVDKPKLLKSGFVRYVRENWRYSKKTIMVALDQQGRVVHHNALHMMMTWGNAAYPFTYRHEENQWNITREWSLTLLLQDIDIKISSSITENKVICLYGGHDYDWITRFIGMASAVANKASIEIEMVYICNKVTTKEHVTEVTKIIGGGGRSELWSNTKSAHFWKRIESMKLSKVALGAEGAGDRVLTELLHMSTLGESENGWAVISGGAGAGAHRVVRATGDAIPNAFHRFEDWGEGVGKEGFTAALNEYLANGNGDHCCTELVLPGGGEDIPEIVVCSECGQTMERRVTFVCRGSSIVSGLVIDRLVRPALEM